MKKSLLLALLILLAVSNISVVAQDDEGWAKDVLEVNLFGSLPLPSGGLTDWNDSLGASSRYGLGIDLGYFVTYTFVVGLSFEYSTFGIDNNPSDQAAEGLTHRLYSPSLYMKYYPELESNWAPYIKGSVGLDVPKFTTFVTSDAGDRYRQVSYDPALSFAVGAGVFYFVHDYGGLYFEGNYHFANSESVEGDFIGTKYTFDENLATIDLRLGVRILIGPGQ